MRIVLKEIKPVERSGSRTAETVMAQEREIEAALPKGARDRARRTRRD
jgi:23S rRNA (pseudouridine1915-N3)-methyltransferase